MRFVIALLGWKIQNLGFGIATLHQNTETFGRRTPLLRLGTQTEQ